MYEYWYSCTGNKLLWLERKILYRYLNVPRYYM